MLQLKTPLPATAVCVGIDVAKDKLDVCIDNVKRPFTVPNTPAGRNKLIQRLRELPLACIAVESSGGYERPLLFELLDTEMPAAHINPRIVRDYAKSFNQLPRTTRSTAGCWPAMPESASRGSLAKRINSGTCSRTSTAAAGNCSIRSPP